MVSFGTTLWVNATLFWWVHRSRHSDNDADVEQGGH